jgi:hypothetical protein
MNKPQRRIGNQSNDYHIQEKNDQDIFKAFFEINVWNLQVFRESKREMSGWNQYDKNRWDYYGQRKNHV